MKAKLLPSNLEIPGITVNRISKKIPTKPPESLAYTPEYRFYLFLTITVVSYMTIQAWFISSEFNPTYEKYADKLSDGWLFGRKMDLTDDQWVHFRKNLPTLAFVMFAFVGYNKLIDVYISHKLYVHEVLPNAQKLNRQSKYSTLSNKNEGSNSREHFNLKMKLTAVFIMGFLLILVGTSVIFIFVFIALNYYLTKNYAAGSKYGILLMWGFNIAFLFSNEIYSGYAFKNIHPFLAALDNYRGLNSRWELTFNITMLRIMSFDMDYHWKVLQTDLLGNKNMQLLANETDLSEKQRIEYSREQQDYSFTNYFVYLFYLPLYLAGPVISFNDFIYQTIVKSQPGFKPGFEKIKYALIYGVRFILSLLSMEILLHVIHTNSIISTKAFASLSPLQISLVGYYHLTFIWLKLLLIWRFARFFALLDGYSVIENMKRCMSNNYSLQNFWRDWHCSYNRFLVRYLYIPMISIQLNQILRLITVFVFVAVWHDLSLRLIAWAWLIVIIFMPELLAGLFVQKLGIGPHLWYFRYLVAVGGAFNIFTMILANLVGFAVGVDGIVVISEQIFCREGLAFVITTYILLMIHTLDMYEYRQAENRKEYNEYMAEKQNL